MSRYQEIEKALTAINDAVFQELCDKFLAIHNKNYALYSRTGSVIGKQKTRRGTPDSFILLPNGNYIFIEHSTDISAGLSKIEKDIIKCLNPSKSKISIKKLKEIIICINFKLDTEEVEKLNALLENTLPRISLTVFTIDSLALELSHNYRDLVHQYLGLPLDTGQIVSIEKFIEEYNKASRGIGTTLDNVFLHRDLEKKNIIESIKNNDFLILTGSAGVGKTKLALETIRFFLKDNLNFNAYCISYKNYDLLADLFQYLDSDNDYLLFVDDANRIDAFRQIIGFYKTTRIGKLKIIITVRDYALQDIKALCQDYAPQYHEIYKFRDIHIIDIIESEPFRIKSNKFKQEILRIANGNPRFAIMAALLVNKHQNTASLSDLSEMFENYFATFVRDNGGFLDVLNIKCLGIIAFLKAIPFENKDVTISILNGFEISYPDFIDAIFKLEKLELLETRFGYVKIAEQNISTFYFYRAFIKDGLLSFLMLLKKYFVDSSSLFIGCNSNCR